MFEDQIKFNSLFHFSFFNIQIYLILKFASNMKISFLHQLIGPIYMIFDKTSLGTSVAPYFFAQELFDLD